MNNQNLTVSDIPNLSKFFIQVQIIVNWIFFPITGILGWFFVRVVRQNTIIDLKKVRADYHGFTAGNQPTMVCCNHLTMIDSFYLHYALSGLWGYMTSFRRFSWNLPAVENFKSSNIMSFITWMGKTIPIDRSGSQEHIRKVLAKIRYVLSRDEICTIFPEGGRSRSGLIELENVQYGVGNILRDVENPRVVCIYLRGLKQGDYTAVPHKGDKMYVKLDAIYPKSDKSGIRASKEISMQIITKLKEMEDEYFRLHPEAARPGK